ncbi:MAG: hypothetical protein A3C80_03835 [Candidatus Ryanbacteria bacterium RIFCSPHIGHO2_02_FULL_45_43]|uniref:30S ribosomal protein S21 n=1 Tax=Candidatus Ryanbacteria bacterium RIFCSPHIGHO2_01_45_13 TaxID=1802112 RepID=A0A1G2FZU4_9BACT|nr:MAG: hypothetical protein A2718_03095 [Candidatus Ryanbacteria bacterium RIFCSPHIGHO2_01_FULL_44_130]OGZ43118.1 MAG: hypothetical protein A2W41_00280 [Candidatus Ryanbacteria bacterium RIFCSPHIGHO2_01_45_13]OGZ47807.1 MAG: hypothetical protein A3C80_03835 [Candidatus Ryanbacteria bacterium RIFCSPHIGHO2_02_FULL_45_43]OGZ49700.1 MAG: hypothetical protein A3E55_02290 [Candidatus Ryanbacteria bacterium RIFCSPHIGHO2_12_FULL_44_20]OGZ52193.1 MAG: hypothetical protein A3A17_03155 [Candidatus Ryanba
MVEVRRRDKESSGALARRFSRKVQYSSLLITARSLQFRARKKSKARKKKQALHREMRKKEFEHLKKLGKSDNV